MAFRGSHDAAPGGHGDGKVAVSVNSTKDCTSRHMSRQNLFTCMAARLHTHMFLWRVKCTYKSSTQVTSARDDDVFVGRSVTHATYEERDGDAGGDDWVTPEVCVGGDGAENGCHLHAPADDVGDLRGVDALDVAPLDQVDDEVAACRAHGHTQPHHAPCTCMLKCSVLHAPTHQHACRCHAQINFCTNYDTCQAIHACVCLIVYVRRRVPD